MDGNIEQEKITIVNELLRHTIIGVELFQESFFNLRFGYNFRRSEELRIIDQRNFSGICLFFEISVAFTIVSGSRDARCTRILTP